MAIPISYNIRNLVVRKTTTFMTALGIGLTVAVLVAAFALVEGTALDVRSLRASVEHPGDAQGLRQRAELELRPDGL